MAEQAKLSYADEVDGRAKKVLVKSIEVLSGRRRLERIYDDVLGIVDDPSFEQTFFWGAALDALQVKLAYDARRLAQVPRTGPVIFIANHPYGVVDGIAICHLAAMTRKEFRILINNALCRENRVAQYTLPIDFTTDERAIQINIDSKRRATETLRRGGALIIFPGGGISTAQGPFGKVTDLEWKLFMAKLVHMTKATVVPIFFHGQNSRLFQIVSQFSLTLRLALIIHEVNKQIDNTLRISIGEPIAYENLSAIKSRQELTDHLRQVVYSLGYQLEPPYTSLSNARQSSHRY